MSLDEEKFNPGEHAGAESDAQDVEARLAAAERGTAGQALQAAAAQIAPDPEFALHLEARLVRAAQPQQQLKLRPRYRLQAQDSRPAASWGGRVFGQRRVQFAMSGLAVSLAVLAVFGLSVLFRGAADRVSGISAGQNDVVPAGKVRHLVLTTVRSTMANPPGSSIESMSPITETEDMWVTNGRNHLLLYSMTKNLGWPSFEKWVNDDAIYDYPHGSSGDRRVYKYPYNPAHIEQYPIGGAQAFYDYLLQLPTTRIIGNSVLDGRPVLEIERVYTDTLTIKTINGGDVYYGHHNRYWIDANTHRLLQSEYIDVMTDSPNASRLTSKITLDEIRDASEFPADFFTFKLPAGAQVVEGDDPLGQPTAEIAASMPTTTALPTRASKQEAPRVGAFAPDFTLDDVRTNQPVKLSSLRGKPVLVNFWGTWCPPCREEMPELQKIYDRVKGQVEFLGISMGPRDEPAGVDQFVKLNKYTWTFLHDTDSSVSINYQVTGIPSTFFIDKDGVIRSIYVGGAGSVDLENGLEKAIAQAPTPTGVVIYVEPTYPIAPTPAPTEELAPRMPLEEFKKLYDDPIKRPYIIDVRSKEAYDAGHIEGAVSFPEADVDTRVGEFPKDRLIVAYCQ